ncbi:MAG: hypothetical protein ACOYO1_06435 [Bacteroidales bacterium]
MERINKSTIVFFLLCLIFANNTYCQKLKTIDCNSVEKPLISIRGQKLNIQCDTVVLITAYHYRIYEKARLAILSTDLGQYDKVFEAYNRQSVLYKQWNDSLKIKYTDINTLFKNSLENTKNSLTFINNNLSSAKDSLGTANNNLADALQQLKTAKHERWFFASVGFLVGSLLTVLVIPK